LRIIEVMRPGYSRDGVSGCRQRAHENREASARWSLPAARRQRLRSRRAMPWRRAGAGGPGRSRSHARPCRRILFIASPAGSTRLGSPRHRDRCRVTASPPATATA
jgi:hypothetical protein